MTTVVLPGGVPLELVPIPAGSFEMGSAHPRKFIPREEPVHPVAIAHPFQMARFEVTQRQWYAVMGDWPSFSPPSVEWGAGDDHPVYFVGFSDLTLNTIGFLDRLNEHIRATGQGSDSFRLPSEAEWEYACRAGTTTEYHFGDSNMAWEWLEHLEVVVDLGDYAWYTGNNGVSGSPSHGTMPVGGRLPNAFGLFDMHGNVQEICEDHWHDSYAGAPSDGSPWLNPNSTDPRRVVRGGSWAQRPLSCRSAARADWASVSQTVGFRLVRSETPPAAVGDWRIY